MKKDPSKKLHCSIGEPFSLQETEALTLKHGLLKNKANAPYLKKEIRRQIWQDVQDIFSALFKLITLFAAIFYLPYLCQNLGCMIDFGFTKEHMSLFMGFVILVGPVIILSVLILFALRSLYRLIRS